MHNIQDLNSDLANLRFTLAGLAADADREADDRVAAKERAAGYGGKPAAMPDEEEPRTVARYFRHCEEIAKTGRLYIGEPPHGAQHPMMIPGYWEVQRAAVSQNRVVYARESDPWKMSQMDRPRPAPIPVRPPLTEHPKTPPAATPAAEDLRGKARKGKELSRKEVKTLRKMAKGY